MIGIISVIRFQFSFLQEISPGIVETEFLVRMWGAETAKKIYEKDQVKFLKVKFLKNSEYSIDKG